MLPEQWQTFKRAARREKMDNVPMALIVDSPWIPGYLGIKHLDYYLDPELWFEANLKIMREYPDIIFIPSWWMEYGMAAEPSVLGSKIKFWQDTTRSSAWKTSTTFRSTKWKPMPSRRSRYTASAWRGSASWTTATFCRWPRRAARCAQRDLSAARRRS